MVRCSTAKHIPVPPIPVPVPDSDTILVMDRIINPTIVHLDGSRSKVLNGDGTGYIKSFKWRQIRGKRFVIDSANNIKATTIVKASGKSAYELIVYDNQGHSDKDTFSIIVP